MDDNIKIRKGWPNKGDFSPETQVHKVKTDYDRKSSNKKAIEDALAEMEDELNWDD